MDIKEFGSKVKSLRVASGLSQEDMGVALGVSHVSYGKIERGTNKVMPPHSQLAILARTFSIPIESLYGADEFILMRFDEEEQTAMKDARSTQYIKLALAKFMRDEEFSEKTLYQKVKDASVIDKTVVTAQFKG
jgi:transcriptional regulator with XRE-family HTH domain